MFEETEKHVPYWAICTTQQLKNSLASLKRVGWDIANDAHKHQSWTPLHILHDELAERYPDIHSPKERNLDRTLTLQSVGISLGFIDPRSFRNPNVTGETATAYAYPRKMRELNEEKPVPIGQTIENVGLKLA
jgi:hypothetical protein